MTNLLSPTSDIVFKKIFGENKTVLMGFINAVLKEKVTDLKLIENLQEEVLGFDTGNSFEYLNGELPPELLSGKLVRLDICAKLSNGTQLNIEMQMNKQADFGKRTLFYWARLYAGQLQKGQIYKDLKKTICINILDWIQFPQDPDFFSHHLMTNTKTKAQSFEEIEIFCFELPKLQPKAYNNMSNLEKWAVFFTESQLPVLKEIAMGEPALKEAVEELEKLSKDPAFRAQYEARLKLARDIKSNLVAAQEEGEEKGRKEGEAKGRAEGRAEGRKEGEEKGRKEGRLEGQAEGRTEGRHDALLATAKKMRVKGLEPALILEMTGLTIAEIEKL